MSFSNRLCLVAIGAALAACGKTAEIAAVGDGGAAASGGSAGAGGSAGGTGGAGGSGGTAGASGSGGGGSGGTGGAAGLGALAACELPTGAIRMGVFKSDPVRNLCFALILEPWDSGVSLAVTMPGEWKLNQAFVWNDAWSCGFDGWTQSNALVEATSGSGSISWPDPSQQVPTQMAVNVTLEFPPDAAWVPESETLAQPLLPLTDCASCNARADAYAQLIESVQGPGPAPGSCTSVVRLDFASRTIRQHQLLCGPYAQTTEAEARAVAEAGANLEPAAPLLSGPDPADQWVFLGPQATDIPEQSWAGAAVSSRTGLLTFAGEIAWFGAGPIWTPATWLSGVMLGGGCPMLPKPSARGFYLRNNPSPNVKVTPYIDDAEVAEVLDVVWSSALPEGIKRAWGNSAFDAVVLLHDKSLGAFDPSSAEYVVLVDSGWLE